MVSAHPLRWTTADLELFPDDGKRYEIIDGELFVTRSPHIRHQGVGDAICSKLRVWSEQSQLGNAFTGVGIIFTDSDNVIADVVWVSHERYDEIVDSSGHLRGAPELVVEVLSASAQDQRRDRELKLKLYSIQGVKEYWIADRQGPALELYRREGSQLQRVATLYEEDVVTSPILPGFSSRVGEFFV